MVSENDFYIYIFSWKTVTKNALELYDKISSVYSNTYIINCDETVELPVEPDRQIQLCDDYYYGGQFQAAIRHVPKNKILGIVNGDVYPTADWSAICKSCIHAFSNNDIGVYGPDVTQTTHRGRYKTLLRDSLYHINNTDCTCWFISPDVHPTLSNIPYFDITNFGWGIDMICAKEAYKTGLHVVRDYSVMIDQPSGTGYHKAEARDQMKALLAYYKTI
jgi:hypothetical protein